MKKPFVIYILLFLASCLLFRSELQAQEGSLPALYRIADPFLKLAVYENPTAFASESQEKNKQSFIRLVVESTNPRFSTYVKELGGKVHTTIGNYYTVKIEKNKVGQLASLEGMRRLVLGEPAKLANELAIKNVKADKVHEGAFPLPRSYTGKDVVLGVIDSGIDFRHEDFRDPDNPEKSRIVYLWDQTTEDGPGQSPNDFYYGKEWKQSDIENELSLNPPNIIAHLDTQAFTSGHGTHVMGTAGGNHGLAPEADLIMVASTRRTADIIDATNYIWEKAEEMGKPCVINMSFGGTFNPHDGTSILSTTLNQMLESTRGLVIVAAAGNEGNDRSHWGDFELDPEQPMMMYGTGVTTLGLYFRIPKSSGKEIFFSVALDSADFDATRGNLLVPHKTVGQTEWISADQLIRTKGKVTFDEYYHSDGSLAGTISLTGQEEDTHYAVSLVINDGISSFYNWRNELDKVDLYKIMVKGKGSFNAWISSFEPFILSEAELRANNIPTEHFIIPDNKFGVTSPADAENILSVGAYINMDSWTNIEDDIINVGQEPGQLAHLSSLGPTIDGRVKPDITAPGVGVISSFPAQVDIEASKVLTEDNLISYSPPRAVLSGTSMSSPVVAGSVALLLEHNPFLTHAEVKELITNSAIVDEDVLALGSTPNRGFGFGKLNVLDALLGTIELTNIQDVDPADNLFNFSIYPNPVYEQLNLRYTLPSSGNILVKICNAIGQPVYQKEAFFTRGNHNMEINAKEWASGWYIARITDGKNIATKVFVKNR